MNGLHEAPLVDLVRRRYRNGTIFSMIGNSDIVVSVNPYRHIPGLFENMSIYNAPIDDPATALLDPHIYATANTALKLLASQQNSPDNSKCKSQSILISGESGAGKTEASKAVINFLIHCDSTA